MRQTHEQAEETFREQCRRQMGRPLAVRIKYGFSRVQRLMEKLGPPLVFDGDESPPESAAKAAHSKAGGYGVSRVGSNCVQPWFQLLQLG